MRKIEVEPDLRVRFGGRGAEFDDGVEVGIVAAQMAAGLRRISRSVGAGLVPQLEALARSLSYRLRVSAGDTDGAVVIEAERTDQRPQLRVIS